MKRARSTLCIKELDEEISRSIRQQAKHRKTPSLLPTSRSQSYLLHNDMWRQVDSKKSKQKVDNKIYALQKRIVELQQQIESGKTSVKNYSKQLVEYEKINSHIQQLEAKITQQREKIAELRNQLCMMGQEKLSTQFNAEQRVAEKEYLQDLIERYRREYEEQSSKVMQLIGLEEKVLKFGREIQELQTKIGSTENKLKNWKDETEFDLNQHKIKNNIKMARMELIRLEDACDVHCSQHNLKKIRELCCQYFKIYAKKNGIGLEEAEEGADIFFCRAGIVQEFRQFLSERIIYNKPHCHEFDRYFETLSSIEKIYTSHRNKARQSTHALQLQEVNQLKQLKQEMAASLLETKQSIKKINAEIENQFGMQSLAVIEYLRQRNNNKYDIKEIKSKLKQNKKEQGSRIARIKEAYHQIQHLDIITQKDTQPRNKPAYQPAMGCLDLQIKNHQAILAGVEQQLAKLQQDKDSIQHYISRAISKWRERDEKKDKLKQLYLQLAQARQTNHYALTRNGQHTPEEQAKANAPKIMNDSGYENKLRRVESVSLLGKSKSVLALSNPFKTIMDRQSNPYKPIIEDCQMILSRQLSRTNNQNYNPCDTDKTKKDHKGVEVESIKKTKIFNKSEKENICDNRTIIKNKSLLMSRTNYTVSAKPSSILESHNKRQTADSRKLSLSKLLKSKFTR